MKQQKYDFSSKGIDLDVSALMDMKDKKNKAKVKERKDKLAKDNDDLRSKMLEDERKRKKKKGAKNVKLPNNTIGTVE